MPRYRQEVINIRIADILREIGFKASGETISSGKLPDVMVEVNGIKVNIEGDFVGSPKFQSLKERCKRRLEERICDIALALIYPLELKEAENDEAHIRKIKRSNFQTFIFSPSPKGIREESFGQMNLTDIAEKINHLYFEIIDIDLLKEQIEKVNSTIQQSSEIALASTLFFSSEKVFEELKKVLGIKREREICKEDIMKMAFFIIFDGLLFHEILSNREPSIQSLKQAPKVNFLSFINHEWEKIMKINYLPIFTLAHSTLNCFPTSPESDKIFNLLSKTALDVISSGVLLKHDLMGRVYHKLLLKTTGKHYAAYYTSIPAAWLLSNLAIKTPNPDLDWNFEKLKSLEEFKIIDPACGSGTLLSGIYMALQDKYIFDRYKSKNPENLDLNGFHKLAIEKILNGWDILDFAGHLTLTTLAFHNPNAPFKFSHIYVLPAGEVKDVNQKSKGIYLGSLDYLVSRDQQIFPLKDFVEFPIEKGIVKEEKKPIEVRSHCMDIVIMNPPFSRSAGKVNIKFGYSEKAIIQKMNAYLKKIGKKLGYKKIGQAGLGAYFVILADKLLKVGGRLALVIPRAILSGVSWEEIREILQKKYEIEYIISNYDPGNKELGIEPWNWSENTDLGEVLIVARKTNISAEKRYITFINLWNKPKNELESLKVVTDSKKFREEKKMENYFEKETYEEIQISNKKVGIVYNLPQEFFKENLLMPCLFAHPELNKLIFELTHKKIVPLIPMGRITDKLGVDRKQVEENFKLVSHQTPYPVVWGHPPELTMVELSNYQYASLKKKYAKTLYDEKKGNLLIAERIWIDTLNVVSLFSPQRILATMFWEIPIENEDKAKILSMWLNSTFGFLLILASSINNKGNWFNLKKEQLSLLPVLNVDTLSLKDKQMFLNLFSKIKNISFASFPEEFRLASNNGGLRKQIDDEFIKILKMNIDLKPYYKMLSNEPALTLKRL